MALCFSFFSVFLSRVAFYLTFNWIPIFYSQSTHEMLSSTIVSEMFKSRFDEKRLCKQPGSSATRLNQR